MAFNFIKWIFGKKEDGADSPERVTVKDFLDNELGEMTDGLEGYLQRLAFWTAVRKIGSTVGSVTWETFRRGKKVQASEYWAWNRSPNVNQSSKELFMQLIGQLYLHQEALIIETKDGSRYVAESFAVARHLSGDVYTDVMARGESIPGTFTAKSVIRLTITGDSIRKTLSMLSMAEDRLLKSGMAAYVRQQGTRGILKVDDTAEADPDFQETYEDLVTNKFKKYFTAENAVLPLFNGYEYKEMEGTGGSTKSTLAGTRDIRNMIDDMFEMTARAFGIPLSILTGKSVTQDDFEHFMTATVKPLVESIEEELNRKLYNENLEKDGTYIKADLSRVKYENLFELSGPIDKLIGSGAFCINDIRVRLGLEPIDKPWAWQHWMTKNYASVEDLNEGLDEGSSTKQSKEEESENEEE